MQLGKLDVSQSEPELSCKTVDIGVQDNQGVTSESQNSQLIASPTALALYEGEGFRTVGLRHAYYVRERGPAIDAWLLRRILE